jgi:hypothetical protein
LIDAQLYLPKEWAEDKSLRKKLQSRTMWPSKPNRRLHWS